MYNNHYETTLCFYLLMFLLQMYNIHYISLHCKLFSDWFKSENSQKSRHRIQKNVVSPLKIIIFEKLIIYEIAASSSPLLGIVTNLLAKMDIHKYANTMWFFHVCVGRLKLFHSFWLF
jgi:hypothetical protein